MQINKPRSNDVAIGIDFAMTSRIHFTDLSYQFFVYCNITKKCSFSGSVYD
jgi:hypothetical protein